MRVFGTLGGVVDIDILAVDFRLGLLDIGNLHWRLLALGRSGDLLDDVADGLVDVVGPFGRLFTFGFIGASQHSYRVERKGQLMSGSGITVSGLEPNFAI